jgi:hypothetical protein
LSEKKKPSSHNIHLDCCTIKTKYKNGKQLVQVYGKKDILLMEYITDGYKIKIKETKKKEG